MSMSVGDIFTYALSHYTSYMQEQAARTAGSAAAVAAHTASIDITVQ